MTRLKRTDLPPHLHKKFWLGMPKGARVTPPQDLQLQNFPIEEPEHTYPRWDEILRYNDEGCDGEC